MQPFAVLVHHTFSRTRKLYRAPGMLICTFGRFLHANRRRWALNFRDANTIRQSSGGAWGINHANALCMRDLLSFRAEADGIKGGGFAFLSSKVCVVYSM